MVKDVTKFHKRHPGGWGMLECVCVCRVSYRISSFGWGEELQTSVLTGGRVLHTTTRGIWRHAPPDFYLLLFF